MTRMTWFKTGTEILAPLGGLYVYFTSSPVLVNFDAFEWLSRSRRAFYVGCILNLSLVFSQF